MDITKLDNTFLVREGEPQDINVVSSKDSYLYDKDGRRYIDFTMGWCVGNLGWGNEEISSSIRNFRGPTYVSPGMLYEPWIELARLLADITPGKLTKSFRATGGSEAVDIALRTANAYTRRPKFISIEGSYHGDCIGGTSIGSSSFREHQKGLLFESYKIKPPLNNQAVDQVATLLKQGDVAAVIMEPIICNLAVYIPEYDFMERLQSLCKEYGALLIIDEVATGIGRTGKLFGCEHYNLEPDIICLAKAMSGGYAPIGAVVATEAVAQAMEYESSYWSTFGWHPLSVAATLANLNYILANRSQLELHIEKMSDYFKKKLHGLKFNQAVDIRIKGLAIGLVFESGDLAKKIVNKARSKGLILSLHNDTEFTMFPALNITPDTAEEGLAILEQCVS